MGSPGDVITYAGRRQLEQQRDRHAAGLQGRSRWSTRRSAASRTSRGWTPGTVEFLQAHRHARRVVGRSGADGSKRRGTRRRLRRTARPPSGCIESRTRRSSTSAPGCPLEMSSASTRCSRRWSAGSGTRGSLPTRPRSSAPRRTRGTRTTRRPPRTSRQIRPDELVLLDLWGKLDHARRGLCRHHLGGICRRTAGRDRRGLRRDCAPDATRRSSGSSRRCAPARKCRAGRSTGPARDVITAAGYGEYFIHRTGHSLGEEVHGNGVHMDDYETHDDRTLVSGTGFTIEPGIYTKTFGVRTEINMVVGPTSADVTGPSQQTLVRIRTNTRR